MYLFSDHMGMKDQVIISMSGGGYVMMLVCVKQTCDW